MGGLLASGILTLERIGSLERWRMIFLIEGIITTGIAVISYFLLTDRIDTARWLSAEEKELANARLRSETVASHVVVDKMRSKQVRAGIFNATSLTMAVAFLLDNISVQGVAFFLPTIVRTLFPGRTVVHQQLLTVPPYVVGAFFVLLIPYMSMKTRMRGVFVVGSGLLMVIGYAMYVGTSVSSSSVRYAASFIVASGAFPMGAMMPGWASANCNSDSARAGAIGIVVMLGNAGGLIACWSYLTKDAPDYLPGNALNVGAACGIVILSALLTVYLQRENRRREAGQRDARIEGLSLEEQESLGHRHPAFRYSY